MTTKTRTHYTFSNLDWRNRKILCLLSSYLAVLGVTAWLPFIVVWLGDQFNDSWLYTRCSGVDGIRHLALPLLAQFFVCGNNNEHDSGAERSGNLRAALNFNLTPWTAFVSKFFNPQLFLKASGLLEKLFWSASPTYLQAVEVPGSSQLKKKDSGEFQISLFFSGHCPTSPCCSLGADVLGNGTPLNSAL